MWPRNEQAESEKCFQGSLFSTEVTWEKLKSDEDKFLPKKVASTIIETECFFHLFGFFVNFDKLYCVQNDCFYHAPSVSTI